MGIGGVEGRGGGDSLRGEDGVGVVTGVGTEGVSWGTVTGPGMMGSAGKVGGEARRW